MCSVQSWMVVAVVAVGLVILLFLGVLILDDQDTRPW